MTNPLVIGWRRFNFRPSVRQQSWELIADLMDEDLALHEALEQTAEVAQIQGAGPVATILHDIRAGIPRAEFVMRIKRYAPGAEALLFQVVNQGDAKRIFRSAAQIAGNQDMVHQAYRAVWVPMVFLAGVVVVLFFMLGTEFYPDLMGIMPMERWPKIAQIHGRFTMWFCAHAWWIGVAAAAIVCGLRALLPRWTAWPRAVFDRFMPFSLYKTRAGMGFYMVMIELGRMGITLNSELLSKLVAGATPYEKSRIEALARALETQSWGEALQATGHDFPSRDLNAILAVLSQQANWVEKFARFFDRWVSNFDRRIKERTASLTRLLLLAVVGNLGITVYTIISISQTLQSSH